MRLEEIAGMADATLTLPPPPSEMAPGDAPNPALIGEPLPTLPPGVPQPTSFADVMAGLSGRIAELPRPSEAIRAEQEARAARERQGGTLTAAAAEMDPKLQALEGAYAGRGAEIAATPIPQAPVLPPPPSRGLRAFLATGPNEAPEATLQKVMAGIMTLATSMGGLVRGDGRAALAALSGATQGWAEGDKERADRAFSDWKAKTDQMLTNYNLERASYKDAMEAKALPLEMQRTALMLAGHRWDNAKAISAFQSGDAEKWAQFVGAMSKEGDQLVSAQAKLWEAKELKDATLTQAQAKLDEEIRHHLALEGKTKEGGLTLKELETGVRTRLAADPAARAVIDAGGIPNEAQIRSAIALANQDAINRASAVGQNAANVPQRTPTETMRRLEDLAVAQTYVDDMRRLSGIVRLDQVLGGLRPVINEKIQTGRLGFIPLPESVTSRLTPDELRFLSLTQDYADTILRLRSGAAINESEFRRMIGFIPEQSATPAAFVERLKLQDDLLRTKKDIIRGGLEGGGYRAPDIAAPPLAPASPAPASASTGTMRIRRKSDGKIFEGPRGAVPSGYEMAK